MKGMFMLKKLFMLISFAVFLPAYTQDELSHPGAGKKIDLPLTAETQFNQKQDLKMSFQDRDVEGWLNADGNWYIKGIVTHSRLRCANYQLGVQLGKGKPACLNVEWITDVKYGTSKKHCNSAPRTHVGGGEMPELRNVLKDATCVRVVTRCTGTCGK